MKREQFHSPRSNTCPRSEEWRRFIHGLLGERESYRLAAHLDSCKPCRDLVASFSDDSDTVIGLLQSADADYSREAPFRELSQRLVSQYSLELSQWFPAFSTPPLPAPLVAPHVPNPLDDYLLLEPLGRGSMGCVFQAQHQRLKRVVAVKVLSPKYGRAKDVVARFEREMQAIGALSHPNVVAATDAGEDHGYYYLVMEYVDGLDLQTILRRLGPLSVANACETVRQACLGLEAAHQQGLVHRDVKPSNLLLSAGGVVKVLDLGLVTLASDGEGDNRTSPVGTAPYMAPEQWTGRAVDIGADIYSTGCTLFKLLTGRAPFEHPRSTIATYRQSHCEDPVPAITELRADVPPELSSILGIALAKQRQERFASPAAFAEELEPFVTDADLTTLVPRARKAALEDTHSGTRDATLPVTAGAELPASRRPWRRLRSKRALMALVMIAGAIGFAALFAPRNDLQRWKLLDPSRATDYWSFSGRPVIERIQRNGQSGLRIKATDMAMIALGTIADDTYAIRTTLGPLGDDPIGVFFGANRTLERLTFYSVEVREMPSEQAGTHIYVGLYHHDVQANPPGPFKHFHPVIEAGTCAVPTGTKRVTVEVHLTSRSLSVVLADRLVIDIPRADLAEKHELVSSRDYGLLTCLGEVTFTANGILDLTED